MLAYINIILMQMKITQCQLFTKELLTSSLVRLSCLFLSVPDVPLQFHNDSTCPGLFFRLITESETQSIPKLCWCRGFLPLCAFAYQICFVLHDCMLVYLSQVLALDIREFLCNVANIVKDCLMI